MIKNIVFDIGNVILKWEPAIVVARIFADHNSALLTQHIFKSNTWYDLNRGKITEQEAIQIYHHTLNLPSEQLTFLMQQIKESLVPVENSLELLQAFSQTAYPLYALTDNVHEIIAYLKAKYHFWDHFTGVVVSAEVGYLKPSPEIYEYLLVQHRLNPAETVFIDDVLPNVEGAKSMEMHAIQFKTVAQCIDEMKVLHIKVPRL